MVTCEKGDGNYGELPALDQTVERRIRPRLDRLYAAGKGKATLSIHPTHVESPIGLV